jgi:hypothetical protein
VPGERETMKKSLLIGSLLAVALSGCLCANPSKGTKVGTITSLAQEGLFCPTWEGTLIRGGLVGGSGAMGQTTRFNIPSDTLAQEALKAMEENAEVEITFERKLVTSVCDREYAEDVTVTSIRRMK